MKLMEGRAESFKGHGVGGWFTQQELVEMFRISASRIRELEGLGLPSKGSRKRKRYPFPHALAWFIVYRRHIDEGEVVERLPIAYAMAAYRALVARDGAELDGTLRVRRRR